MCEILVRAVDGSGTYAVEGPRRGHMVVVQPDGHTWGTKECPPEYFVIKIPGAAPESLRPACGLWNMGFKFTVVSSVPATDTHTIKLEATRFNRTTGEGKLTRTMVENFLTAWGGANVSVADNSVTFTVKILDAIVTNKFWGQQRIDDLFLSEKSYVPATGVHKIEINYSLRTFADENARAQFVKSLQVNATLVTDDPINKIAVLDVARSKVRDAFMEEVRQRVETIMVKRRRWVIAEALMAQVEAAGGVMTINQGDYNGALIDRTV